MWTKKIFCFLSIATIICASASANTPTRGRKVYPKIIKPLPNVFLVIHGGDQLEVNYHRFKKSSASMMFIATGGLAGGLIAAAAAGHVDEAEQQDLAKQDTLQQLLAGWNFGHEFKDAILGQLAPNLKNVTVVYIESANTAFMPVEQSFYNRGPQSYTHDEIVYDYTPLIVQSATHVIEVDLDATMMPINGFAKKMMPIFSAHAAIISLEDKSVLLSKRTQKMGNKFLKDTFENISTKPEALKTAITQLATIVSTQLSKKLK